MFGFINVHLAEIITDKYFTLPLNNIWTCLLLSEKLYKHVGVTGRYHTTGYPKITRIIFCKQVA